MEQIFELKSFNWDCMYWWASVQEHGFKVWLLLLLALRLLRIATIVVWNYFMVAANNETIAEIHCDPLQSGVACCDIVLCFFPLFFF